MEKIPDNNIERAQSPERMRFPVEVEVLGVIRELIGDVPYKVVDKREDEDGLYSFRVRSEIPSDGRTEYVEYEYLRGRSEKCSTVDLNVVYYAQGGDPYSGSRVAVWENDEWKKL